MSLARADVVQPKGPLAPSLFPGEDAVTFGARVDAYLAQATVRLEGATLTPAALDDAMLAWVEHRAYGDVFTRLSVTPASASVEGEGGRSYLITQIQHFRDLRDEARERFRALVPVSEPTRPVTSGRPSVSGSTGIVFGW